ncbi:hypothetical protein QR680_005367 [Steinernema hermaphroditum]|uniref:carnitine O-palmitoyltransferase n=1 Tax=Steinernema hermaphroditum TaxID=289476 RepID=A0AA39HTX9_9BILA|nr:hypothetical protein QR680_005367 [Steinernema hermaphroditum]
MLSCDVPVSGVSHHFHSLSCFSFHHSSLACISRTPQMADARSAVALGFSVTHEGVSVSYDVELLQDIWHAFSRATRRRMARFKNDFVSGIFPANASSLVATVVVVCVSALLGVDMTFGVVHFTTSYILWFLFGSGLFCQMVGTVTGGALFWFLAILLIRLTLKWFLSYKGWLYEDPHAGKPISLTTRLWMTALHFISRSEPLLHSFQGSLPNLPLPALKDTLERHLLSMRPLTTDAEYEELTKLSEKFLKGDGCRLQRYLWLKSLLSTNYVTDWWEEYVYMRQRSPIMVNSNYYGFDTINERYTNNQAARAGNLTYAALLFRRQIERQEVSACSLSPTSRVPFCTMQYERLFNSCRIPGEETDKFKHFDTARHIAVYSKGCWFKMPIHTGKRLLEPAELQAAFQEILDSSGKPAPGEERLAALTAGERTHWALARKKYFSRGFNKSSLRTIEGAAFVVALDHEDACSDPKDTANFDRWAHQILHGNGYNRWFDKSFTFVISKNARFGCNTEHSWGDAAITAHFMEFVLLKDFQHLGYEESGNCRGSRDVVMRPERLKWELGEDVQSQISVSLKTAEALINDVEMALLVWTEFGKGLIKKLKVSPDAFIQLCLQLTYFRNQKKFCLTYEAAMARLFREGRTETVRSCTSESCDFVRAMLNPKCTEEERLELLRIASRKHQNMYRDAMSGKGVDRHLFALYVVKRYLEEESPFLDKIFPPTYLLSTSQTPLNQCEEEAKILTPEQRMNFVSAGGGFGPVADKGYGVSYVIGGENQISFHISSKKSASNTSSVEFRNDLMVTLREMRQLLKGVSKPNMPAPASEKVHKAD